MAAGAARKAERAAHYSSLVEKVAAEKAARKAKKEERSGTTNNCRFGTLL